MKLNIGENIRILRRQRGITQEQLADAVGISFQAVSKWENGITMPDIALLPTLASFFGVTIDTLMSYDRREAEADIQKTVEAAFEYRESDPQRSRSILEDGLAKYPENDVLLANMLYVINYSENPDETIALASRIIALTDQSDLKYDALRFLAYAYNAKGDKTAAIAALEQVPELYFTKLSEMAFIAEGKKKYEAAEKQLWISFEIMLQMLWKLAECSRDAGDIPAAHKYVRRAVAFIDAMEGEEKQAAFMNYREFFEKRTADLEG